VATTVDLYLRDQTIRGELHLLDQVSRGEPRAQASLRLVDLLNGAKDSLLVVRNGVARSLHVDLPPVTLGAVRVQRTQTLLVVPADPTLPGSARLRVGYIEKHPHRAQMGLGPLHVTATLHFGPREPATFEAFAYDASGRFFIPATDAIITSQYRADWSVETPLVYLNRVAVDLGGLVEQTEASDAHVFAGHDVWFGAATRRRRFDG
jgi:hypothetical protein